jgi:hypothetical protein
MTRANSLGPRGDLASLPVIESPGRFGGNAADRNDLVPHETETGRPLLDADAIGAAAKALVAAPTGAPAVASAGILAD